MLKHQWTKATELNAQLLPVKVKTQKNTAKIRIWEFGEK